VDGDSLVRGTERLRLIGIDAPELHQTCRDPSAGADTACGRQAQAMLAALIRAGGVTCNNLGTDRYGRTLTRCLNGRGEEVNRAMVLAGWALAAEGDPTYAAAERQAAAARRGVHALLFERPSAWRRAHPR
jgi:endonuclease YncB( thermonuclease family)